MNPNFENIDVTTLVSDMLSDMDGSHGFAFKMLNETPFRCVLFASSDHEDPALRPRLRLLYSLETNPCVSDLDNDGFVDINDFLIFNSSFGVICD